MDEPRVVIGVPLATPWIYWRTIAAILEMEKPMETDLMVFQGALVDRARNHLVEKMLHHPMEATHLLFLDADIVPPANTLQKLLSADRPIISALYRRRLPPYEPMAFRFGKEETLHPISSKKRGLKKVDVVGAGCLLIQRRIFKRLKPPWFFSSWSHGRSLSEDFSFCKKVRAAGFEIYVDTTLSPLHLEPMGVGTSPKGSLKFIPMD